MQHFFPVPMDYVCLPWGLEQCQQWMAMKEDVLQIVEGTVTTQITSLPDLSPDLSF